MERENANHLNTITLKRFQLQIIERPRNYAHRNIDRNDLAAQIFDCSTHIYYIFIIHSIRIVIVQCVILDFLFFLFPFFCEHNRQPSSACNGYFGNSVFEVEKRRAQIYNADFAHYAYSSLLITIVIYLFGNNFNNFRHHISIQFKYSKNICRVFFPFELLSLIFCLFCWHFSRISVST